MSRRHQNWIKIPGGVPCPVCGNSSSVVETYWCVSANVLQRRRKCKSCHNLFRTAETVIQKRLASRSPKCPSSPPKSKPNSPG